MATWLLISGAADVGWSCTRSSASFGRVATVLVVMDLPVDQDASTLSD